MKICVGLLTVALLLFSLPMAAQVGGVGTTNHVPLWTSTSNLGSRLTALLIEAIKSQQVEIQQLKSQVLQLTSAHARN